MTSSATEPRRHPLAGLVPHLALIASVVMLGLSFVALRAIMVNSTGAATLAVTRYGLASMFLLPFCRPSRLFRLPRQTVLTIFILGAMQFGMFQFFVNTALKQIPASRGAVIFALIPIMTMLIAAAAGRDRLSTLKIIGALIAFTGVALAIGEKAFSSSGNQSWLGEILFFLAVSCGATYNAFSARLLQNHDIFSLTFLAMGAGTLVLTGFALFEHPLQQVAAYDVKDWLWVLYLAGPAAAIGFFLFNFGLRQLSPARASIWVPLSPISAAAFGALLLDEHLSGMFLIGLACTVTGPFLVNWRRNRDAA